MSRALRRRPEELADFLFGPSDSEGGKGLIAALEEELDDALDVLRALDPQGGIGFRLDVRA